MHQLTLAVQGCHTAKLKKTAKRMEQAGLRRLFSQPAKPDPACAKAAAIMAVSHCYLAAAYASFQQSAAAVATARHSFSKGKHPHITNFEKFLKVCMLISAVRCGDVFPISYMAWIQAGKADRPAHQKHENLAGQRRLREV